MINKDKKRNTWNEMGMGIWKSDIVEKSNNRTRSKPTNIEKGAFEIVTGVILENVYRLLLLI